jgi:hypothetical protein
MVGRSFGVYSKVLTLTILWGAVTAKIQSAYFLKWRH